MEGTRRALAECRLLASLVRGSVGWGKAPGIRPDNGAVREYEVVPIDASIGRLAGDFVRLYRKSHSVELPDALIAATAVEHRAPSMDQESQALSDEGRRILLSGNPVERVVPGRVHQRLTGLRPHPFRMDLVDVGGPQSVHSQVHGPAVR